MKALSAGIAEEDYVSFARLKGVGEPTIMGRYVMRNAILPQITQLALNIGTIFNGALITEILFGYPGLGTADAYRCRPVRLQPAYGNHFDCHYCGGDGSAWSLL